VDSLRDSDAAESEMNDEIKGKGGKYWMDQIQLAKSAREEHEPWWEANLEEHSPGIKKNPKSYGTTISTNRTFTMGERKSADLFYQKPDVTLQPMPLMEAMPEAMQALQAHQEILNEHLGEDGIDVTALMDQVKFDILITSGDGATVMGYEQYSVDVPDPRDPEGLLGLPMVPVPIDARCFWEHLSPKQVLKPHNFRSNRFDKAPWLGYTFELPLTPGNRRKYNLSDEFKGSQSDGKQHFDTGGNQSQATEEVFTGTRLWYRSNLHREDRPHPDHLTEVTIIDGNKGVDGENVVDEKDCPYQTIGPKGKLTPDSLIGFPIHIFSVRTKTDSAYVESDATMIRPLEYELNVYRTQQVQFRDAATLKWVYNTGTVPADVVSKMVRAPLGGMIGAPPELFPLEHNIVELPQPSMPRESFAGQEAIDNDISRTTGVDASGAGVQNTQSQTATAEQIQASNAGARMDKERSVLLKQYLKGVTKYSTLVQRFFPLEDAAAIVGPQRAQVWEQWRKVFPSALSFTAMPDSALRVDQAVDRKQAMDLYSFIANDPFVQKGRQKLIEKLLRKHHIDPTGIVFPPDAPKPEPPKLSISIKMEDFVLPQGPITCEIAAQLGLVISPEAITLSQGLLLKQQEMAAAEAKAAEAEKGKDGDTTHPGKTASAEPLSKHHADQTGGMQNTGAPAALGAGGGMI
jgi:hypothetical protein